MSDYYLKPKPIYRPRASIVSSPPIPPPPPSTPYVVVDDGNCSPRYIRSTTYAFPSTHKLALQTGLPLSLLITPFASHPECEKVPVVKKPIIRCERCGGYVNPWVRWDPDGRGWDCNLCGKHNTTDSDYLRRNTPDALSNSSTSVPFEQTFGTVDVHVGEEYCIREQQRPIHMFAIEETEGVLENGLKAVSEVAKGLKEAFESAHPTSGSDNVSPPPDPRFHPTVGFFTFSSSCLRFFSCIENGEVSVNFVTDVKDSPFAAIPAVRAGFDVVTGMDKLQDLIDRVPDIISKTPIQVPARNIMPEPCSGAAILALGDSLIPTGGKGYLMTTTRPTYGSLTLRKRENRNHYTDKEAEVSMFSPIDENSAKALGASQALKDDKESMETYSSFANDLARNMVCLDIFMCPFRHTNDSDPTSQTPAASSPNPRPIPYCDAATLGSLTSTTGGSFSLLKRSSLQSLAALALRSATRPHGNEAVVKVRTSIGIQVKGWTFCPGIVHTSVGGSEVEIPSLDADKTLCCTIEHDSSKMSANAYFQCATLFTSTSGVRTVRVSTLALPTSSDAQDVFRASDQDALCACLSRKTVQLMGFYSRTPSSTDILSTTNAKGSMTMARKYLIDTLVTILANYRKYTEASQSPAGQLILPDALKLFPLFILSFLKSNALRCSLPRSRTIKSHPPSPRVDVRATRIYNTCFAPLSLTTAYVHPNFYDVVNMDRDIGLTFKVEENGEGPNNGYSRTTLDVDEEMTSPFIKLPPTILPSMTSLTQDGVYLMDAVDVMYLYVTRLVQPSVITEIFNVDAPLSDPSTPLPTSVSQLSDLGRRLNAVIDELKKDRSTPCPLEVIVQGREDCAIKESGFMALLVDDSTIHEVSYVDFLVAVHRKIQSLI